MKKTVWFLVVLVFIPVFAFAVDLELQAGKSSYSMGAIKPGNTLKLTVAHKGWYLAGENETFMVYGQDMAINSVSVGYRHQFKTSFFIYGQAGYYRPEYDPFAFGREAIYIEQSKHYNYPDITSMPWSDHYRLEFRPGYGAEIGGGVKYNLTKNLSVNLSAGYRYLRLWADYDGLDAAGAQYWIMSRSDNFDAVKIYGGLCWEF